MTKKKGEPSCGLADSFRFSGVTTIPIEVDECTELQRRLRAASHLKSHSKYFERSSPPASKGQAVEIYKMIKRLVHDITEQEQKM